MSQDGKFKLRYIKKIVVYVFYLFSICMWQKLCYAVLASKIHDTKPRIIMVISFALLPSPIIPTKLFLHSQLGLGKNDVNCLVK